jgi:hypothetical protein
MQNIHPLRAAQKFARGESYWRVVLTTGRVYSELDRVQDTLGKRPLDWYRDVCSTSDIAHIAELWLHTPAGPVALKITERNSAYIFNSSVMSMVYGKSPVAQIIGRVDDKATGTGIAFIWDVTQQQMYKDEQASVLDFKAWRPGIADVGALAIHNMGVTL